MAREAFSGWSCRSVSRPRRQDEINDGNALNPTVSDGTESDGARFSLLGLLIKGGALMIPIMVMSVLVVALVIERFKFEQSKDSTEAVGERTWATCCFQEWIRSQASL